MRLGAVDCSDPITAIDTPSCWIGAVDPNGEWPHNVDIPVGPPPDSSDSVLPGVSNQALVLGAGGLLAAVLLLKVMFR